MQEPIAGTVSYHPFYHVLAIPFLPQVQRRMFSAEGTGGSNPFTLDRQKHTPPRHPISSIPRKARVWDGTGDKQTDKCIARQKDKCKETGMIGK